MELLSKAHSDKLMTIYDAVSQEVQRRHGSSKALSDVAPGLVRETNWHSYLFKLMLAIAAMPIRAM